MARATYKSIEDDDILSEESDTQERGNGTTTNGDGGGAADQGGTESDDDNEELDDEEYEVESILKHRNVKGVREYKIRWKGFDSSWDTWEPEEHLDGAQDKLQQYIEKHLTKKPASKRKSSASQSSSIKRESLSASKPPPASKRKLEEEKVEEIQNESDDEAETFPAGLNFKKNLNKSDWEPLLEVLKLENTPFGLKYFVKWKDGDEGWIDDAFIDDRAPRSALKYLKKNIRFHEPEQ